jgi:hypothetical protein
MDMKVFNNYGTETRRWLLSVIRQRKFLLEIGKSKLPSGEHIKDTIARLELYLGMFSYSNPVNMARFINQHKGEIYILLPGKGSSNYEKRRKEYEDICRDAHEIMVGKQAELSYGSF